MEAARPPHTRRNVWYAASLTVALMGCVAVAVGGGYTVRQLAAAPGAASDAAFWLLVAPGLLLALYTAPFCLYALGLACRRGSRPMAEWTLHLGLLPPAAFLVLRLCSAW